MRGWLAMFGAMLAAVLMSAPAGAQPPPQVDVHALFDQAEREARVGLARKTVQVDARPARPGEVVVTLIAGEGKETQSPPAKQGDMVVRNRCPETGNEEILVEAAKFTQRYDGPEGPADAAGWRPYRPRGVADALPRRARGRWRLHLHRTLGRADGGAAWRCDRARPAGSRRHLPHRRRRLRLHLRDRAARRLIGRQDRAADQR